MRHWHRPEKVWCPIPGVLKARLEWALISLSWWGASLFTGWVGLGGLWGPFQPNQSVVLQIYATRIFSFILIQLTAMLLIESCSENASPICRYPSVSQSAMRFVCLGRRGWYSRLSSLWRSWKLLLESGLSWSEELRRCLDRASLGL